MTREEQRHPREWKRPFEQVCRQTEKDRDWCAARLAEEGSV